MDGAMDSLPGAVNTEAAGKADRPMSPPTPSDMPIRSSSVAKLQNLMSGDEVKWMWKHKSGWRGYDPDVSLLIEKAFRRGRSMVRLKTGKDGKTPKEVFFTDMIQYDPNSTNFPREVKREGAFTLSVRAERFFNGLNLWLETGQPRNESFEDYQHRRSKMQDDLKNTTFTAEFDKKDAYKQNGIMGPIARSPYFVAFGLTVVILNALWIAIELDRNEAANIFESEIQFQVIESTFCVFFVVEILIRFCAWQCKRDCFRDGWFMFDFFLVIFMLAEISLVPLVIKELDLQGSTILDGVSILRMLRLLRLTKALRMVPQLMCLMKGIVQALIPMMYMAIMLFILLFVFGVLLRSQVKGIKEPEEGFATPRVDEIFGSVTESMLSLLLYGSLMDGPGSVVKAIKTDIGLPTASLFGIFIFLSAFTVLNMLIGILCEVVSSVTAEEKENSEIRYLQLNLLEILKCYDKDMSESIGEEEFRQFVQNPEVDDCLKRFGTDIKGLKSLRTVLFENGDKLEFNEILETVKRLRGANTAKVTDIIELREFVRQRTQKMNARGEDSAGSPTKKLLSAIQGERREPSEPSTSDFGSLVAPSESMRDISSEVSASGSWRPPCPTAQVGLRGAANVISEEAPKATALESSFGNEAILVGIRSLADGQRSLAEGQELVLKELKELRERVEKVEENTLNRTMSMSHALSQTRVEG